MKVDVVKVAADDDSEKVEVHSEEADDQESEGTSSLVGRVGVDIVFLGLLV